MIYPRKYLYYNYFEFGKDHSVIPHVAAKGNRHKLLHFYTVNGWEPYDIKNGPRNNKLYQIRSAKKDIITDEKELIKLPDQYDDYAPTGKLH